MGSKNLIFVGCGALLAGVWLFTYANRKGSTVLSRARKNEAIQAQTKEEKRASGWL